MIVNLVTPISISITSAQLVVEDNGTGTIEFQLFGQPVYLNIASTNYTYDISFGVNDKVELNQGYGAFLAGSRGTVIEIIPDPTNDTANVLFDYVVPDQVVNYPVEASVNSAIVSLLAQVPISSLEKVDNVTYNGNGNSGGIAPVDANWYASGDTVTTLDQATLLNTGHTFNGWNTAANGTGTQYAVGDTFAMGLVNVILFAQWM